jgi:hypothetical protein
MVLVFLLFVCVCWFRFDALICPDLAAFAVGARNSHSAAPPQHDNPSPA